MADFDKRFYLIGNDGSKRFAALLNGRFQVGKARDEYHTSLATFARAVIVEGEGGRSSSANGTDKSILVYKPSARSIAGYWLDSAVASEAGLPPEGRLRA